MEWTFMRDQVKITVRAQPTQWAFCVGCARTVRWKQIKRSRGGGSVANL